MASFFNKIEAALTPLAKNVERKLGEAYQIAGENLGFAKEITQLPEEYLLAERRVAALRELVATVVAAYPPAPRTAIPSAMMAKLAGLGKSLKHEISETHHAADESASASASTSTSNNSTTTAQQLQRTQDAQRGKMADIARAGYTACDALNDDPFSATVRRYADSCETVASLALVRRRERQDRVVRALRGLLDGNFATCAHACEEVVALRRRLDVAKVSLRGSHGNNNNNNNNNGSDAGADSAAVAQVAAAEDKFVAALQVSSSYMRGILENTRILVLISEMVRLDKEYHRACEQALADAETFMRDNTATHEAIFGSSIVASAAMHPNPSKDNGTNDDDNADDAKDDNDDD